MKEMKVDCGDLGYGRGNKLNKESRGINRLRERYRYNIIICTYEK